MKIRIMTLNAWGLPAGLARETPERMRAIGDQLGALGADLIALEEIWTASSRELLMKAAPLLAPKPKLRWKWIAAPFSMAHR
jgi:hypothetical protein